MIEMKIQKKKTDAGSVVLVVNGHEAKQLSSEDLKAFEKCVEHGRNQRSNVAVVRGGGYRTF